MSYSYYKFLRPITTSDKSIKVLDDNNDIKYTINPFVITNASVDNNLLRINLKSLKVIIIGFSTKNEAKLALIRLQQQIDTLTNNVPILIDKDIQNYVQDLFAQVSTGPQGEIGPTGPQGEIGPTGLTGSQGEIGATGAADRYSATSSTTFEVPVIGEFVNLTTQINLAYTTAQNVVIYSDLPNLYNIDYEIDGSYFIGQIDYYDKQTGDMSLITTYSFGTGSYSYWYINLSGMIPDSATNSGTLDLTNLTTDIIPATDSLYNLGTSASQWKSLHVSGQTIYIGGVPLSTDGESLVISSINLGTTASPLVLSSDNNNLLVNGIGSFGATGPQGVTGSQGPQGATGSQGVAHIPKYKVYTALLLQSGGGNELSLVFEGPNPPVTEVGVTYEIVQIGDYIDFTSIGAPDNNVGTKFIATEGSPGTGGSSSSILSYNTGAPVVTVLENTIGNIWFSYEDVGIYSVKSDGLFTENKTWNTPVITLGMGGTDHRGIMYTGGGSYSTPDPGQSIYYIRLIDSANGNTVMFTGFFYVDNTTHIIQTFYDSTNPTVDIKSTGGNGGPTYLYYPGWLCFDGGGCNITSFPYLYGSTQGDYNLYGNVSSSTGNVDGYGNVTYEFSLIPPYESNTISIKTSVDKDNYANDLLNNTPIEIRVYN